MLEKGSRGRPNEWCWNGWWWKAIGSWKKPNNERSGDVRHFEPAFSAEHQRVRGFKGLVLSLQVHY